MQLAFGMMAAGLGGALLIKLKPFAEGSDDTLATTGQVVIMAQFLTGLLIRVQDLLPAGTTVAGDDQAFDRAALATVVVVAVWGVPALGAVGSVVDAVNAAWQRLVEANKGTPTARILEAAPLWRIPLFLLGVGLPRAARGSVQGPTLGGAVGGPALPPAAAATTAAAPASAASAPVVAAITLPASGGRPAALAPVRRGWVANLVRRVALPGVGAGAGTGAGAGAGGCAAQSSGSLPVVVNPMYVAAPARPSP
jgi:hypothetical protein